MLSKNQIRKKYFKIRKKKYYEIPKNFFFPFLIFFGNLKKKKDLTYHYIIHQIMKLIF